MKLKSNGYLQMSLIRRKKSAEFEQKSAFAPIITQSPSKNELKMDLSNEVGKGQKPSNINGF